jgi:hypothetical protein
MRVPGLVVKTVVFYRASHPLCETLFAYTEITTHKPKNALRNAKTYHANWRMKNGTEERAEKT